MLTNYWTRKMDHDELVKLAGEQALLSKRNKELSAENERGRTQLSNVANGYRNAADPKWVEEGKALIDRLHTNKIEIDRLTARIADLAKLTGI
jgi:hypothetical protein